MKSYVSILDFDYVKKRERITTNETFTNRRRN